MHSGGPGGRGTNEVGGAADRHGEAEPVADRTVVGQEFVELITDIGMSRSGAQDC